MARKRRENRGGVREGAGRKPGPQPHLRSENPRRNRVSISITDAELTKLVRAAVKARESPATLLYRLAQRGGL